MRTYFKRTTSAVWITMSLVSTSAWCGDVYVITNSGLAISADDIKDIYTGDKLVEGGVKLTPIDNNTIKADFLDKVVHMPADKYASMWGKKVFRDGLTAPITKSTDADVIALVKAKPGNIGYVTNPTADVKVIKKF